MKNYKLVLALIFILTTGFVLAEDNSESINTDDLFGDAGDIIVEESSHETDSKDFTSELLTSDTGVTIGGKYFFEVSADITESDLSSPSVDSLEDDFSINLGTSLFFDARPDDTIRVLGKVEITYPFTSSVDEPRNFDDVFHVTELFSDFNIDDKIFFRAGKSTINWGVGYYFSPADLLNLSQIDPENPDDELEGPVSVKMNIPSGSNNFYLYIISPEGITSASELAVAPKAEFVVENSEIGIGAYYQKDHAPAAMATLTSAVGDVSVFSEGVVSYGSDKTFVTQDLTTVTYDDRFFFKGTAGFIYSWSDDLSNFSFNFSEQYFYNGEGYSADDQDFVTTYRPGILAGIMNSTGIVSMSDILNSGRHYGAGTFSWDEILQSDFTFRIFWLGNLSDGSGLLKPSLSYTGFNDIDLSLSVPYSYGEIGDEYTPSGDSLGVTITFSFGGTAF